MSVETMRMVFMAEISDLPYEKDGEKRNAKASTVKLLLLAYADHANDEGEAAYPGYTRLERKTALSRQGIADTLVALTQNGFMTYVGISNKGTGNYKINSEKLLPLVKPLDQQEKKVVKPLDYQESSGLTSRSQVAGLESSFNHPLTRDIDALVLKISQLKFPIDPKTADYLRDWRADFPGQDDIILRALELTASNGAHSLKYADRILIGWKANGVPPTREEQKEKAKNGNFPRSTPADKLESPSAEDLALAERLLAAEATAGLSAMP